MKKAKDLISDAWRKISSENSLYSDQWLCDETWYRVIRRYYPSLPDTIKFNRTVLNRALTPLSGSYDQTNIEGIYHANFFMICPYEGKKRNVSYYFRTVHGAPPSSPTASSSVQDIIAQSISMQIDRARISALEREKSKNDDVSKSIIDLQDEAERKKAIEAQMKKDGGCALAFTNHNKSGVGTQLSCNIANESNSNT